jgi:hypothetical protein
MNVLVVANDQLPLCGSARNQGHLTSLNGQTVATIVRDTLRRVYKKSEIKVSRTASFDRGQWQGCCRIRGVEYTYKILTAQPYGIAALKG